MVTTLGPQNCLWNHTDNANGHNEKNEAVYGLPIWMSESSKSLTCVVTYYGRGGILMFRNSVFGTGASAGEQSNPAKIWAISSKEVSKND